MTANVKNKAIGPFDHIPKEIYFFVIAISILSVYTIASITNFFEKNTYIYISLLLIFLLSTFFLERWFRIQKNSIYSKIEIPLLLILLIFAIMYFVFGKVIDNFPGNPMSLITLIYMRTKSYIIKKSIKKQTSPETATATG